MVFHRQESQPRPDFARSLLRSRFFPSSGGKVPCESEAERGPCDACTGIGYVSLTNINPEKNTGRTSPNHRAFQKTSLPHNVVYQYISDYTEILHPYRRNGEKMSRTRRDFMKEAAVMGGAAAAGGAVENGQAVADEQPVTAEDERCPYFDQPMYCKGLSKSGKPLCEE